MKYGRWTGGQTPIAPFHTCVVFPPPVTSPAAIDRVMPCMCRPVMPRAKRWREIDRAGKIARFRVFWLFRPFPVFSGLPVIPFGCCSLVSVRANHANPSPVNRARSIVPTALCAPPFTPVSDETNVKRGGVIPVDLNQITFVISTISTSTGGKSWSWKIHPLLSA